MGERGGAFAVQQITYFMGVLSVLILIHELGHFAVAKWLGIRVERFSFGFGPKLFSIRKGDTEYRISLILFGGYIKMCGDEPHETLQGKRWEFLSRPVRERFAVIFAGPFFNYVLAFLVFSMIFMFGSPACTTEVGALLKDYPAENVGLAVGDRIMTVNGKPVRYWEDMTEIIHRRVEGTVRLTAERKGRVLEFEIRPIVRRTKDIFGKSASIALIGIMPSQKIEKARYAFPAALVMGAQKLFQLTALTYRSLLAILIGQISLKESMTGPIGIFVITGKMAELGVIYIFHLMAVLSASLAIFNLLPLPVLDGGHLFFLLMEKIRRRPLSARTQEIMTNAGIALLVLLMLFVLYGDMAKFGFLDRILKFFRR